MFALRVYGIQVDRRLGFHYCIYRATRVDKVIVEGRYEDTNGIVTSLPPINNLEFLDPQTRYVKATKDITLFQGQWICFQGYKILWLSPRYRPTCYAANDDILALGHGCEEVIFVKLSFST